MIRNTLIMLTVPALIAFSTVQAADKTPSAGSTVLSVAVSVDQIETTGYRASKLLGADIKNETGQDIGSVDDLIIDSVAEAAVAIVSVGGFLGMGVHHVAIPTERFEVDGEYKIVLPGATKKALEKLPKFRYAE